MRKVRMTAGDTAEILQNPTTKRSWERGREEELWDEGGNSRLGGGARDGEDAEEAARETQCRGLATSHLRC